MTAMPPGANAGRALPARLASGIIQGMTRTIRAACLFLLLSAVFTAAYCQAPLYYSNQHQYSLHGLARAGHGLLADDWLANTADPTPAFSALVAFTAGHLHPWGFHVYHALLLGAYAAAMLGLFIYLSEPAGSSRRDKPGGSLSRRWPVFLFLLLATHCALFRWLSYQLVNFDYPWFLQAGVAGQYILGSMLQPSVFGVLLVVALCLFVHDRPYLAALCTGLAGAIHSTYFLMGAMVTLGFLVALLLERRPRAAVVTGAIALAVVLPAVVDTVLRFAPTSPDVFARAQDVLVNLRIPHHSRVDLWLDPVAWLQIGWVLVALALTWRTRLFPVLAVPAAQAVLLTLVQLATGSQALALLFPWRISSVLVPVATAVILARLVLVRALPLDGTPARALSFAGILALAAAGVWISATGQGFRPNDDELPLLDFVRANRSPGEVYLLPVRVPDLAKSTRGSLSSDFKPLPDKRRDQKVIPIDLQRFRLYTGVPIYVDFKSIPYKDTDLLEWRDRLLFAEAAGREVVAGRLAGALPGLRERGITHVVTPASARPPDVTVEKVYEDEVYRVYRLEVGNQPVNR
jgi:hypothetical protein